MNMHLKLISTLALAAIVGCSGVPKSFSADKIVFTRDIQPLLESTCFSCHKEGKDEGGLKLLTRSQALKGGDGRGPGIVPGNPAQSAIYKSVILPKGHDDVMPPKGDVLTKPQTEAL